MQEYESIIISKIVERRESYQDVLSACNDVENMVKNLKKMVKEEVTKCHQFPATIKIVDINIGGKNCLQSRDDLEFDKIELEIIPEDSKASKISFEIGAYKDMTVLEPIGAPYCCGQFQLNRDNWLQECYNHPYLAMYSDAVIEGVDSYLKEHGYSCSRCE